MLRLVGRTKPKVSLKLVLNVLPLCQSSSLRLAASQALVDLATDADRQVLQDALMHEDVNDRSAAVAAYARLIQDDQLPWLHAHLKDAKPAMQLETARV